jgi:hypothetical protein
VNASTARIWHTLVAAVAVTALVLQFVLVLRGGVVLDEVDPPATGLRVARFFAYFTIQSNLAVAASAVLLARDPERDGAAFRVLRIASIAGITVTGIVHFFLLRPLLDLSGADFVADKLLHMVVPVVAIAAWVAVGPRPRIDWRACGLAMCWPLLWLTEALSVGTATGWYPYPFLDHREDDGVAGVVIVSLGITIFFILLFVALRAFDHRARPVPSPQAH